MGDLATLVTPRVARAEFLVFPYGGEGVFGCIEWAPWHGAVNNVHPTRGSSPWHGATKCTCCWKILAECWIRAFPYGSPGWAVAVTLRLRFSSNFGCDAAVLGRRRQFGLECGDG